MQVGIDSYCFHRYFGEVYESQKNPGVHWDVYDFLDFAESLGVRNVNLETCFFPSLDNAYVDALRQRLQDRGFASVLAWGHPDGLEGGTNHDALEDLRRHIPQARRLGTNILRFVGGSMLSRPYPHEPQIATLIEWLKDVCKTAEEHQVYLAMENHIDLTSSEVLRIIEGVGSDYLKVNLDTGNMLRLFEDPVEGARRLAPYTIATHTKDIAVHTGDPMQFTFWPSCPVGQGGIIDIPAVANELAKAGYQGTLAVEIDVVHPRWADVPEEAIVRESVAYLRQVVANL